MSGSNTHFPVLYNLPINADLRVFYICRVPFYFILCHLKSFGMTQLYSTLLAGNIGTPDLDLGARTFRWSRKKWHNQCYLLSMAQTRAPPFPSVMLDKLLWGKCPYSQRSNDQRMLSCLWYVAAETGEGKGLWGLTMCEAPSWILHIIFF